jgi:hypothetical protein
MPFVPVAPYVPPSPPSPRTQELARLLSHAIREYEQHNPTLSGAEIREALELAARDARVVSGGARSALAVALGSMVLLAGIAFFGLRAGNLDAGSLPVAAVAVVVVGLLVGLVLMRIASRG